MRGITALAVVLLAAAWPAAALAQPAQEAAASQRSRADGAHAHAHAPQEPAPHDHSAHDPPAGEHPVHDEADGSSMLPPHIPPLTDADRAAAFPDVDGHAVHDRAINYFVLFDQLEWQGTRTASGVNVESKGWIGRDRDRFWFRVEGEGEDRRVDTAHAHVLYGRAIAPWWDVVAGIRQDVRPGSPQTWAAVGIQGLAPYWFDIEATAYVGASGRTHFRFETEYELLFTNRLILQPLVEAEIYGRADPERGIGRGLSTAEWGGRLRYEWRREFAPYVGVVWHRKFFGTADQARAAGDSTGGARLALGLRFWL
jgi:copper resistance protein B